MAERARSGEVIADRYLTSPSRLRERPFGPVDALDTHAGRASQVRIVFVPGDWDDGELADAVARWCAIGADGVCGVLDFGRHDGRPYLVLPPTLGIPVDRWRTMRTPSAADAARLALGFGRLLESTVAGGFGVETAEVGDFAVGPGPTPFLELPLLRPPGRPEPIGRRSGGQALLAALFEATVHQHPLPAELEGWRRDAQASAFDTLAACLDALERSASRAVAAQPASEPLGLAGVFDAPLELPAAGRADWRRRIAVAAASVAAAAIAAVVLGVGARPASPAGAAQRSAGPPAAARPVPSAARTAPAHRHHRTRVAAHRTTRPRRRLSRTHAHPASPPAGGSTAPAATPSPPPSPPASTTPPAAPAGPSMGGATELPAPGATVLPAP